MIEYNMDSIDEYRRERLILLNNLSNQVSDINLKIISLIKKVDNLEKMTENLDNRIPERKTGYLGGYWELKN